MTRRHVEWPDVLYMLGVRIHELVLLLTYLLTQLARMHKAGNISETVENRAKATINATVYNKVVHLLSIATRS